MLTFQKLLPTLALALALAALGLSVAPFAADAAAANTPSQKAPYSNSASSTGMVAGSSKASPADNQGEPQYSENSKGPSRRAPIRCQLQGPPWRKLARSDRLSLISLLERLGFHEPLPGSLRKIFSSLGALQ